ncbi:MAG: DNA recombination protein RmuC [Patescibacteria group bacterium]|nr:DNA recombination protein RmuC [Patescibacteria group bacterium]MDD5121452.1 DNA recombination protein RmuC [Patescibacteria group bacterium]MDD5222171.1 DNA recombination protein RmuC [Patescibacteria group bacterium]MDD5396386.1 DNA recombination protein RmuC [Patescibacteria group bacterium]
MNYLILIILLIVIAGMVLLFRQLKLLGGKNANDQSPLLIQAQLKEIRETMDNKLRDVHQTVQRQSGQTNQIIRDVTEKLTKLDETNKQVINFTDQLQSLQDILKNPKQRGVLGEYYLETVLKNVLPPGSYQRQYPFKDGTIVDAVVFVKDKVIPIDSKFSLENYNRLVEEKDETERARLEKVFVSDLKLRIQETAKYIQPSQGTMDFAFMFIPHEAIYYDLIVNKIGALKDEDTENLIQRAASKYKVIIVSPTSFLAYLQTVLQGLRALQIEESAKEIRERVEQLGKHILTYDEYFKKLGNNLGTTVNSYNTAYKELNKIDRDIVKITDGDNKIEPLQIDKPDDK